VSPTVKPHPVTVLVVDDDLDRLGSTCRVIGAEYPVVSATSGEDALQSAMTEKPDLIVLDVVMPGGMDGFSLLSKLAADPATRDIPVVIFSEMNDVSRLTFDNESLMNYLGCAPDAFVAKSAPADALLTAVRNALGPSAASRRRPPSGEGGPSVD